MRNELNQLKANIRYQTEEELSYVSANELDNLQKQLESALGKLRQRKAREGLISILSCS